MPRGYDTCLLRWRDHEQQNLLSDSVNILLEKFLLRVKYQVSYESKTEQLLQKILLDWPIFHYHVYLPYRHGQKLELYLLAC